MTTMLPNFKHNSTSHPVSGSKNESKLTSNHYICAVPRMRSRPHLLHTWKVDQFAVFLSYSYSSSSFQVSSTSLCQIKSKAGVSDKKKQKKNPQVSVV
jgi:hypothetical protein